MKTIENIIITPCIQDPKFKSILIENPNALASIISSITPIRYEDLKDNMYITTNEIPIEEENEKFKKCDFIVEFEDDDNEFKINVEANAFYYPEINDKNTEYVMDIHSKKTKINNIEKKKKENNNGKVKKKTTIQINLNDYHSNDKVLTRYMISDPDDGEIYVDNFVIYCLDVAKCYEMYYTLSNNVPDYVRWGAFLHSKNLGELDKFLGNMLKSNEKDKLLGKVKDINMRKDGTLTKKEAKAWGRFIEDSLKRKGYEEGKEQGIKDGFEQGIEQGTRQGIEQGIEQKTTDLIKSMLENHADYEFISNVTKKTIEEIKEIEKTMNE